VQIAAAGSVADKVALDHGDGVYTNGEGLADERRIGFGRRRAAAAGVRRLVRLDARGGRDGDDVEIAPVATASPHVGLRAAQVGAVLALAECSSPVHGGVLPLAAGRERQGAVLELVVDDQVQIAAAGSVTDEVACGHDD